MSVLRFARACLVIGCLWLAAATQPFTWPAYVVVVLAGAALIVIGSRARRTPPPEQLDPRGTGLWLLLLVAFAGWEVLSLLGGSTPQQPSLSGLLDPILEDSQLGRFAGFFVWAFVGWRLIRR